MTLYGNNSNNIIRYCCVKAQQYRIVSYRWGIGGVWRGIG